MAFLTTALIIAGATLAAGGAAAAYHSSVGSGPANKTTSTLDLKRRRDAEKAQKELSGSLESNGRYFVPKENRGLVGTRPSFATQPTQATQATLPTIATLPTLQTGYHWQEYQPQQMKQLQKKSELFIDRTDTYGNNGLVSTLGNLYRDAGKFVENNSMPRWALALATLGFSEAYAQTASLIDNYIWDIDGDGKDSMLKNVLVDPWIEVAEGRANVGQALLGVGLNTLTAATEVFDVLANPIKGIANNGWQGFLDAIGAGGNGYVAFDWNTNNFVLDLVLETLSDPLSIIDFAKTGISAAKGIARASAKTTGKNIAKQSVNNLTQETTRRIAGKVNYAVNRSLNKAGAKKYTDSLVEIIESQGAKKVKELGKHLGTGSVAHTVKKEGKSTLEYVSTVAKNGKKGYKPTLDIIQSTEDEILQGVLYQARKAKIPIDASDPAIIGGLKRSISKYLKDIKLCEMTTQIVGAVGGVAKQAKFLKTPKILNAFIQAQDAANSFQQGLGKIAWYGTAPEFPLLLNSMKAIKPFREAIDIMSKRKQEIMSTIGGWLTNRVAYNFQKGLSQAFKELNPESYSLLRKAYSWSSAETASILADNVKVGSKKVIKQNQVLPQTSATAFQKIWMQKFGQDTEQLAKFTKNHSEGEPYKIMQDWRKYLKRHYNKTPEEYIAFLDQINAVEKSITGNSVYNPFISDIKSTMNLIDVYTIDGLLKKNPKQVVNFAKVKTSKGKPLSKKLIGDLNLQTISKKQFEANKTKLTEDQIFRQTNNKVYIENRLYYKYSKHVYEYQASQGKKGWLAKLAQAGYENEVKRFVKHFDNARSIQECFKRMAASPGLYSNLPKSVSSDQVYLALTDAFMGMNNKVIDIDDIENITMELASIAEYQLGLYANLTEDLTGVLTHNIDFMSTLKANIKLYVQKRPKGDRFVTEIRFYLNDLKSIVNMGGLSVKDPELYDFLDKFIKSSEKITADINSTLIIIPTELQRSGIGLDNANSIHEVLMRTACQNENGKVIPHYASTLTPISDGRNVNLFFETVPAEKTFDRTVVQDAQTLANGAAHVFDKIYNKTALAESAAVIEKAWADILFGIKNSRITENDNHYMTQMINILLSTAELPVNKKYALMRYLYLEEKTASPILGILHRTVKDYAEAPAQHEIRAALKNFNKCTNRPVTVGTGLSIDRARRTVLTASNLKATSDLQSIISERDQVSRSLDDLEMQIKNVANADPLLAQQIVYTRRVKDFYNTQIKNYKEIIESSVFTPAITQNLEIVENGRAKEFFDEQDYETIKDIYDEVEEINPEHITQLLDRAEAYNQTVIYPEMYKEEFFDLAREMQDRVQKDLHFSFPEFKELMSEIEQGKTLSKSQAEKWNMYYPIYEKYKEFSDLMTKPNLSAKDLERLQKEYYPKMAQFDLVPNAIKAQFIKEYQITNGVHVSFEKIGGGGKTGSEGYSIRIDPENFSFVNKMRYHYKHESTHSTLRFQDLKTHRQIVEDFWAHLMKGDNAEFAKTMYESVWYSYLKKHKGDPYYFPNGDIFTWDNPNIKEEIMANIIAASEQPGLIEEQLKVYYQEVMFKKGITKLPDVHFVYDDDIKFLVKTYYDKLITDRINQAPHRYFEYPALHKGEYLDVSAPYKQIGEIMHDFEDADLNRTYLMIRHRLRQSPEELAQDLARTGPFQFYSMEAIKQAGGKYSLYRYFDKDFNVKPAVKKELEKYGIGIEVIPEYDTVLFYINKDRVAFADGASYYNRNRIEQPNYNFGYKTREWHMLDKAGDSFEHATQAITGLSTGYSNGFRVDQRFINTLFNGTQDGFSVEFPCWPGLNNIKKGLGGWTPEDFIQPMYYPAIRFNEMILGKTSYSRRFGIYISNNPMVNMSNAIQQMNMMNKTKTEMLMLYFDDTFAINGNGIWAKYSDEDLFRAYMEHPEFVMMTMRGQTKKGKLVEQKTNGITKAFLGNDWNPVRLQEFIPYNVGDIKKAREMGVRFVPKSWYNLAYNTVNNRIGSGGILKWYNKFNFIYKFFVLATNVMTFVRNAIDTYGKTWIELKDDMIPWTNYAIQLKRDYQDIRQALFERQILGDKAIKDFFESGEALAYTRHKMTYEQFMDIREYELWGPSTQGLASIVHNSSKTGLDTPLNVTDKMDKATLAKIDPTTDEITRRIARDVVPGYKGFWERCTDFTDSYFDWANKTIGLDAEKNSRLALYLKAISEGKTKQQAFQWITDVHFDYSVRNMYEQVSEALMPFITFTTKNLVYWIDRIAKDPAVQKFLMNYFQAEWNYYDYDSEQMAASKQWQFLIKSGNIPLTKQGNLQDYFKLNPSFADAFNTFINPLEVAKERLFFPTRALEKTFTEDYKGQNLMGKQDTWYQVMDWLSQMPGNALARRITKAIKSEDTLHALEEGLGAVGQAYMPAQPYIPGRNYGYRQRIKYTYTNNYNSIKPTIQTNSYKINKTYANKYRYDTTKLNSYKRARGTNLGKRILNPNRLSGQNLTKNLYFNYNLYKPNPNYKRTYKRVYTMNQYRIQKAMYR